MKKYTSRGGITAIPNVAERSFARKLEAQKKTWFSQPRTFALSVPYRSYRPDFFVVEDNCFYEVLGSRQAYSQQRERIDAFRLAYPHLTLKIINEGAWATDWNPEVDSRHAKFAGMRVLVAREASVDTSAAHVVTGVVDARAPEQTLEPETLKEFLRKMGEKGGRNRAKALSPARRKEISSTGGTSRWKGLSAEQRKKLMDRVRAKRTYHKKKRKP